MGRFGGRTTRAPGGSSTLSGYAGKTFGDAGVAGYEEAERGFDRLGEAFGRANALRAQRERQEQLEVAKAEDQARRDKEELEVQEKNAQLLEIKRKADAPGHVTPEGEVVSLAPDVSSEYAAQDPVFQAKVQAQMNAAEAQAIEDERQRAEDFEKEQTKVSRKDEDRKEKALSQTEKYMRATEARDDRMMRLQEIAAAQQERALTAQERAEFYQIMDRVSVDKKVEKAADFWTDDAQVYSRARTQVDREIKEAKARGEKKPRGDELESMYRDRMQQLRLESGWYQETPASGLMFDPYASAGRARVEQEEARAPKTRTQLTVTPDDLLDANKVRFRLPQDMRDWKVKTWQDAGLSADWAQRMASRGRLDAAAVAASGRRLPVDPELPSMGMGAASGAPAPPVRTPELSGEHDDSLTTPPLKEEELVDGIGDNIEDAEEEGQAQAEMDADALIASGQVPPDVGPEGPDGTMGQPGPGVPPPTPAGVPPAGPAPAIPPSPEAPGMALPPSMQGLMEMGQAGVEGLQFGMEALYGKIQSWASDEIADPNSIHYIGDVQDLADESNPVVIAAKKAAEEEMTAKLEAAYLANPHMDQAGAAFLLARAKDRDDAAVIAAKEVKYQEDQAVHIERLMGDEKLTAKQKSEGLEKLLSQQEEQHYGKKLAAIKRHTRRLAQANVAAGMTVVEAIEATQGYVQEQAEMLRGQAVAAKLSGKASEWNAAYEQLAATLSDPAEMGKFMLQTGVPMVVAAATGAAGWGMAARMATLAYTSAGVSAVLSDESMFKEDGSVDWNVVQGHMAEGASNIIQAPFMDLLRGVPGKFKNKFLKMAGTRLAGAVIEGVEEPMQELLGGLLTDGTIKSPAELAVAASLGSFMGGGLGGSVANIDPDAFRARLDALIEANPDILYQAEEAGMTPEQLQALVADASPEVDELIAQQADEVMGPESPVPVTDLEGTDAELEAALAEQAGAEVTAEEAVQGELDRMAQAAEEAAAEEEAPAETPTEQAERQAAEDLEAQREKARPALDALKVVMPKQTWTPVEGQTNAYTTEVETPTGKRTLEMRLGEDYIEVSAAALAKHGLTPEQAAAEKKGAVGKFTPAKVRLKQNDIVRVLRGEGADTVAHEILHFYRAAGVVSTKDWATFRSKYEAEAKATMGEKWDSLTDAKKESAIEEKVAFAFGLYAQKRAQGLKMPKAPKFFKQMYESIRQFGVALKGGDVAAFDKLLRQDTKGESKSAAAGAAINAKASAAIRRIRASDPAAAGKAIATDLNGESASVIPVKRPPQFMAGGSNATFNSSEAFAFEELQGFNSNAQRVDKSPAMRKRAVAQMKGSPSDQEKLGIKLKEGDRPTWTRVEMRGAQPVIVQYMVDDAAVDDEPMIVGVSELTEDGSIGGIAGGRIITGGVTNADPLYAAVRQIGGSHSGVYMPQGQEAYQRRSIAGRGAHEVGDTRAWYKFLRDAAPEHAEAINAFENRDWKGKEPDFYRPGLVAAMKKAIGPNGLELAKQDWPKTTSQEWAENAQDLFEGMELTDAEISLLYDDMATDGDEAANIKVLKKLEEQERTGKKGTYPVLDTETEIGPARGKTYPVGHPKYRTPKNVPLRRRLTKSEQIAKFFDEETIAQLGALTGYSNEALKKDPAIREKVFDRIVSQAEEELKYALDEDESGREWYGKNIKAMERILKKARPEFSGKDGDTNLAFFKVLLSVTSTGEKVRPNAKKAMQLFDAYIKDGKLPFYRPVSGLKWGRPSVGKQVRLLDSLLQKHGLEKTVELLRKPMSYDEIVETFGKKPAEITKTGAPGFQYYGAHIFGPKLGSFFQNLDGNFQPLTADLWWSRSYNRWLGLMWDRNADGELEWKVGESKETGKRKVLPSWHQDPRGFNERSFMQEVARHLGEKYEMDTASVQAVLWYYEQRLWKKMGGAVDVEVSYDKAIGELVAAEQAAGEAASQIGEDAAAVGRPARRARGRAEDAGIAEDGEAAAIRQQNEEVSKGGDFWRRITKRAGEQVRKLKSPDGRPVGEYIEKQLRSKLEFQERKSSAMSSQFKRALAAYKKVAGSDWEEGWSQVQQALDNRQVQPGSLGKPERALYTVTRAILNTVRKDAIEAETFSGQMVHHYFPHMSGKSGTFDYDELIDLHAAELSRPENADKLAALMKRDEEWLSGIVGEATVRDLAAMDLGRNFNKESFWRTNPNLEKKRSGAMTDYVKTPEVIDAYLQGAYSRISSGRYLGPQSQVLMEGMRSLRPRDRQLALDVVRDVMGKRREPGLLGEGTASAARELGALNGLSKLGMAALPQITQTAAATSEAVGASGLRAISDIIRSAAGVLTNGRQLIQDAERSGATYAATANEAMQAYAGTGNRTLVERMFTGMFNLGGLIPAVTRGKLNPGKRLVGSTYFVRDLDKIARVYANRLGQLSYLRALESGNMDVLTDLLGTKENAAAAMREDRGRVKQLRGLLESGRAGDVVFEKEMARPPEGDPKYPGKTAGLAPGVERLDMAGKRFADKTQYRTRGIDMPVGFNHPVMKAMNTFYSFHYQHWRWQVEHGKALQKARKDGDKAAVRRHARTMIAHNLAIAPVIGYGSLVLRSFLTGRGGAEEEQEQRDLSELGTYAEALDKVMGLGPYDPRVDPALAYLQAWQFSGGLGYPLALIERTTRAMQKGEREPGRGMSSLVGGAPGESLYDTGKLAMMGASVATKWADGRLSKTDWERFKRQMVRETSHLLPNPFGLTGGVRRELTKSERWPVESPGWWGLVFDPEAYWDPKYGITSPSYQEAREDRRENEREQRESEREKAADSWED